MKKNILPGLSAIIILLSCNSQEESTESSPTSSASSSVSTSPVPADSATAVGNATTGKLDLTPPPIVLNSSNTPAMTGGGPVNPPHGQPGHRCDIAEGAPLPVSGGPVASPSPVTQPKTVAPVPTIAPVQEQKPATTTTAVAKGKNPPHGQPGHRCDIAVGAPLPADNGPVKTAAPSVAVQAPQPAAPAPVKTSTATGTTPKGVNPPHGQPGHRCDIAVGAPLN